MGGGDRARRRVDVRRKAGIGVLAATLALGLVPGASAEVVATSGDVAPMDTDATTDDSSVSVPTGWWVYHNRTLAQVGNALTNNGARLTDLEVVSVDPFRVTVTMVRNSGAYAVPGWWWYVGQTGSQVGQKLTQHGARLVDIEPYATPDGTRYAVVMVANTGASARAWSWLFGATATQVNDHVASSGHRLIDLEEYLVDGQKRYAVIGVANSGADAKPWQYWYGQTAAQVTDRLTAFGGRLTTLERLPNGRFNVVMVKNAKPDAHAWWWYHGLTSLTQATDLASQLSARIIDIEPYEVSTRTGPQTRYAIVLIDNANASTRRIRNIFLKMFTPGQGTFGAYLKPIGGSARTSLHANNVFDPASALKALHLLHELRGSAALGSSFRYYQYPVHSPKKPKDACPDEIYETEPRERYTTVREALAWMMMNSDNRTTRGVVLRAGGFAPLTSTARTAGMSRTVMRQDIGCAYRGGLRNDTTLADLGRLYEGVQTGQLLSGRRASAFWDSMLGEAGPGARTGIRNIAHEEAAKLGKPTAVADEMLEHSRWRLKGGSYGICSTTCEPLDITHSEAGWLALAVTRSNGTIGHRHYVFGRYLADVTVSCWDCTDATAFRRRYNQVGNELFREELRRALLTW